MSEAENRLIKKYFFIKFMEIIILTFFLLLLIEIKNLVKERKKIFDIRPKFERFLESFLIEEKNIEFDDTNRIIRYKIEQKIDSDKIYFGSKNYIENNLERKD